MYIKCFNPYNLQLDQVLNVIQVRKILQKNTIEVTITHVINIATTLFKRLYYHKGM